MSYFSTADALYNRKIKFLTKTQYLENTTWRLLEKHISDKLAIVNGLMSCGQFCVVWLWLMYSFFVVFLHFTTWWIKLIIENTHSPTKNKFLITAIITHWCMTAPCRVTWRAAAKIAVMRRSLSSSTTRTVPDAGPSATAWLATTSAEPTISFSATRNSPDRQNGGPFTWPSTRRSDIS